MEQQLKEQADKLYRYETKLRDIITAYKKLQNENESLGQLLQSSERNGSRLHQELDEKTKVLNDQSVWISNLNDKLENLVLEKNRYREEAEKTTSLKERIDQLLRDLDNEQLNSEKLKSALMEAQEQHEISTQHFETRISDIIATLKTYQEIHLSDTKTIMQLRSGKSCIESKESSSPHTTKPALADLLSSLEELKNGEVEASRIDDLFECMLQMWKAIVESSQLQQSTLEKQLLQRLGLKFLVSAELLETSEKERAQLQQELEFSRLRLQSIHENAKKFLASPSRGCSTSPTHPFSFDFGPNAKADKRKLEQQLKEAQDHVNLLRKQNLTTLLELESVRKSMHSKLAASEEEASGRLAEAASRHEAQLMHTEAEARRYREQMLSLLTEKEEEISELRTALLLANHEFSDVNFLSRRHRISPTTLASPSESSCNEEVPDSTTPTPNATITSRVNFDESSSPLCGHVYCAERHGRMVIELKKLRSQKREFEQRVEQLEARLREERKTAALEITRTANKAEDSSSTPAATAGGGDVNLAYVKNIVFNLLSSFRTSSLASRVTIVKALAMALHFGPEEENALIGGIIG
ncbi:hypothetical protein Aperf_G00000028596 [Anoplocephala perfoliata]